MLSLYSPELYQSEREYLIAMGEGGAATTPARTTHRASGCGCWACPTTRWRGSNVSARRRRGSRCARRSPARCSSATWSKVNTWAPRRPLFTVADLSRVWVLVDLYEMDQGRVKVGDRARFTADGVPGRTFDARIDFVYPTISNETRTLKARLVLDNRDGLLRPGMYGRSRCPRVAGTRCWSSPRGRREHGRGFVRVPGAWRRSVRAAPGVDRPR
jgi:Cu(I)/Ag(I) efflux system membrane fusion protein